MNQGVPNQGPPPAYDATRNQNESHIDDEPLFTTPPEERNTSLRRPTQDEPATSTFGAPPMGEPSEPSAHPDNQTAATHTLGSASPDGPGVPLNRSQSSVPSAATAAASGGGAGLHRHASGAYDTSTAPKGFFSGGAPQKSTTPGTVPQQQTTSQPGDTPVGVQPGSPYVQTQEVPSTGTSPMNQIVGNFSKYMAKAEGIAGNIWSHMKTGPSVTDTARGRVSQGIRMVQEGGFEGLYKTTFGLAEGEQLRKTYASYLSTSTGPVAGTLYISNLQFSFCSDRPLSYAPTPGQQAWSYYKMVLPLRQVKEVIPSFNENKPLEKYIQVVTQDGHDFWFMGFINYDKGVKNMQLALEHIGEIDPNGGLKAPWAGLAVPGLSKTGSKRTAGQSSPTDAQQSSTTQQPGHIPTTGGPSPNYPTARAPNSTSANPQPTV